MRWRRTVLEPHWALVIGLRLQHVPTEAFDAVHRHVPSVVARDYHLALHVEDKNRRRRHLGRRCGLQAGQARAALRERGAATRTQSRAATRLLQAGLWKSLRPRAVTGPESAAKGSAAKPIGDEPSVRARRDGNAARGRCCGGWVGGGAGAESHPCALSSLWRRAGVCRARKKIEVQAGADRPSEILLVQVGTLSFSHPSFGMSVLFIYTGLARTGTG